MSRFMDISNQKFGRWLALSRVDGPKLTRWLCRCDCGTVRDVALTSLTRNLSESCGCLKAERHIEAITTHGLSHVPGHKAWCSMRDRCLNPNNASYKHYGAKGITVCDSWLNSFEAFLEDMGEQPKGLSLDRIDGNLGYSKANCRWATNAEQASNKSNNVRLTVNGVTKLQSEWAELLGITSSTLAKRLRVWKDVERACTTPSRGY